MQNSAVTTLIHVAGTLRAAAKLAEAQLEYHPDSEWLKEYAERRNRQAFEHDDAAYRLELL